MPIAAPTMAPQVESSPALPKKESTGGKAEKSQAEFGKLFREQAGPIQPALSAKVASATKVAFPIAESEGSSDPTAPVETQTTSVMDQSAALPMQPGSAAVLHGSAKLLLHAQLQNHGPLAGLPVGNSSRVLPCITANHSSGPGKATKSTPSLSAKDLQSSQKPKKTGGGDQRNADAIASARAPGQPLIAVILPASPVLPLVTRVPELTAVIKIKGQPVGPLSAQKSGDNSVPSQKIASIAPPSALHEGTEASDLAAPANVAPESLAPAEIGKEPAADTAASASSSKATSSAAPNAGHLNPEKVPAGAALPTAPFGALAPHSSDASVSTPTHVEQAASGANPGGPTAAAAASGPGSPNLYDRIDQGSAPVVLHSGAQHVAVGVHDPDLGWVEIQTQSAAGHVDAMLVTSSGQTHASLAAQLPGMAQYLEQRDVRVGALIVHHETPGGGGGGGAAYGSGGNGGGAQHSGSENSGGGRSASRYTGISPAKLRPGPGIEAGTRVGDDGTTSRPLSYISVRA